MKKRLPIFGICLLIPLLSSCDYYYYQGKIMKKDFCYSFQTSNFSITLSKDYSFHYDQEYFLETYYIDVDIEITNISDSGCYLIETNCSAINPDGKNAYAGCKYNNFDIYTKLAANETITGTLTFTYSGRGLYKLIFGQERTFETGYCINENPKKN